MDKFPAELPDDWSSITQEGRTRPPNAVGNWTESLINALRGVAGDRPVTTEDLIPLGATEFASSAQGIRYLLNALTGVPTQNPGQPVVHTQSEKFNPLLPGGGA